jgi:hypothetical protein
MYISLLTNRDIWNANVIHIQHNLKPLITLNDVDNIVINVVDIR